MTGSDGQPAPAESLYQRLGGEEFFVALVEGFYARVAGDPVLRPLYPPDLEPGKARLASFLAQYWGGPPRYSEAHGHPRLRMRHAHFAIGWRERDAWVLHMRAAVEAAAVPAEDAAALRAYFEAAATMLVNQPAGGT